MPLDRLRHVVIALTQRTVFRMCCSMRSRSLLSMNESGILIRIYSKLIIGRHRISQARIYVFPLHSA